MNRGLRSAFGLLVVLALATGEARAQWGWGWGGWGGSSTVQGDIARGLGFYNIGAGVFNERTAVANAINADTVMRWNQYVWLSQQEANRREYLRRMRRQQIDSTSGEKIYKRLRDNPLPADIDSGDALNVILDQVTDPRIHYSSALRMGTAEVPGAAIQQIPFVNASEAVSFSIHQLAAKDGWPFALRGDAFADLRAAYQQTAAQALEEDELGEIKPETLAKLRSLASRIRAKLEQSPPEDPRDRVEAENYVKTLMGMTRMLERPDVEKVLGQLESIKETTIGNLLGFMHHYNLRFGPARTADQRQVYEQLYPKMASLRDRILKESGIDGGAPKDAPPPTTFFQNMPMDQLEGKAPKEQAQPAGK